MPSNEWELDAEFELTETPKELFIKTGGENADDYEAFIGHSELDPSLAAPPTPEEREALKAKRLPSWRNAKSLMKLKQQINRRYPRRKTDSDGHIGDQRHCRNANHTGNSDHCLNIIDGNKRVVAAMDITHDPANCNVDEIVEAIRESNDSRIKYIIWNKRICHYLPMDGKQPWEWRSYPGDNDHTKHAHFSVRHEKSRYDDVSDWLIEPSGKAPAGV